MLDRLLSLGKSVLAERDLDRMLTVALDGVVRLCGAERGMIVLFDPAGGTIVEKARQMGVGDLPQPEYEISRSIIERVRQSGEGTWHPNVMDDPSLSDRASVMRLMLLSVACQPLMEAGEAFGAVYLDNRSVDGLFTAKTAETLASFADFISLAARNALERRRLRQRIDSLSAELKARFDFGAIVAQDPAMLRVLELVGQVADSEVTVLIRGESGTGKELIARALWSNSRRRQAPFLPINCGALPETLLEAQLFGHERGAFTGATKDNPGWFERAEGGTLFLDEVAELPPALQVKLLRILETGEYARVGSTRLRQADVRILAATNRDLERMVAQGELRQDFLYRLNVLEVTVPPLRQRRSDIALLVHHFLERLGEGSEPLSLSPAVETLFQQYPFPGNVRELENALRRAVLLAGAGPIEIRHLPPAMVSAAPSEPGTEGTAITAITAVTAITADATPALPFKEAKRQVVEDFERRYLHHCLEAAHGNISEAARIAALDYKNFHTKMKKLGLEADRFKG
jgi:transcriptional regulator with GAF, ATPase, and Fis domain